MRAVSLWGAALALAGCASVTPVAGAYPGDTAMWERLVANPEPLRLPGRPRAAIAPHHLIDGPELAAFWSALAAQGPVSTIVLIGPDHYRAGHAGLTIARHVRFDTAFGPLVPNEALTDTLREETAAEVTDALFAKEHSIYVHAPYVRRFFPAAKVAAFVTPWGADVGALERQTRSLARVLPADALLVASVDFSHDQPEPWATFHDEASWASVAGLEALGALNLEVDSPESLFVVERFAELRGAKTASRVLHTNSQGRHSAVVPDSTSHQYVVFTEGPLAPVRSVSLFIAGDVDDTPLGVLDRWAWKPLLPQFRPEETRLAAVRGKEDRFLMGADLLVFDVAPGQRVERTVHGVKVVVAGVSLDQQGTMEIARLRGAADCLVVIAHRGTAPLDAGADALGRLRDAGADVVIGRELGAPTEPDLSRGRLLVRSLGPFLGPPTLDGAGRALGATWTPEGVRLRSLPLRIEAGRPRIDFEQLATELDRPLHPDVPESRE